MVAIATNTAVSFSASEARPVFTNGKRAFSSGLTELPNPRYGRDVITPSEVFRPKETEPLNDVYQQPIDGLEMASTAQAGAAALERPRAVDAVVLNVGRDSVFLECLAGPERTVELPLSLVPSDLRTFGRPVKIELREVGGYRSFLVTGRETQPTGALDGEEEIEDWLARL